MCSKCLLNDLPFNQITNDDLMLTFSGLSNPSQEFLKNLPKFDIKSLIDSLPGEHFEKDDFISDTIVSRYYTPMEFVKEKFNKKDLAIVHLNIASLELHIDELKTTLAILGNPFDIIAITETRLHNQNPTVDVSIPGYDFKHTITKTQNGGAGIYIRDTLDGDIVENFNVSIENPFQKVTSLQYSKLHKSVLFIKSQTNPNV